MSRRTRSICTQLGLIVAGSLFIVALAAILAIATIQQTSEKMSISALYQSHDTIENALQNRLTQANQGIKLFSGLYDKNGVNAAGELDRLTANPNPLFDKIIYIDEQGQQHPVYGMDQSLLPKYILLEQANHNSYNRFFADADGNAYVSYRDAEKPAGKDYFVAEIKTAFLKGIFSSIPTANLSCVVTQTRQVFLCSDNVPDPYKYVFTNDKLTRSPTPIDFIVDEKTYLAYQGVMEPISRDTSLDWSIVTAQPKNELMENVITGLMWGTIVILTTVLLLTWGAFIYATRPIRRLLLNAQQFAKHNYDNFIEWQSHDEYGQLATIINAMAKSLSKNIRALETLSNIDKVAQKNGVIVNKPDASGNIDNLLLSQLSTDNIIGILLPRLKSIISCHHVSIIITDRHNVYQALHYEFDEENKKAVSHEINISDQVFDELHTTRHYILLDQQNNDTALAQLLMNEYPHQVVMPIIVPGDISAVMIFNYLNKPKILHEEIQQAHDIGHRVAGVLSNVESEGKLFYKAHYDALTNLPNRLLFHERLFQAIERANRSKGTVALMFLDLDGFKALNDTYGHDAGDAFLQTIAKRLQLCVRAVDTVSRLGGDEFTVIIPDLVQSDETHDKIHTCATKILGQVIQPYQVEDNTITVSVSIGIAVYPQNADNLTDLLKHADMAMYEAKASGKNCIRYYHVQNKVSVSQLSQRQH